MMKNFLIIILQIIFFILFFASFNNLAISGTIIVGNVLSNAVTLFNEKTLQPIKEIKVGFMPHEVVVSPNGKMALVANFGDLSKIFPGNTLSSIDIANARLSQTIQLPDKSRPHGIAFLSDEKALVTAQGIQSLLEIDVNSGKVEKIMPLPGAGAHMVISDYAKQYAYVANSESGTVCKINLRNFSLVGEAKIGKEAEGLALTLEDDLLFVTDRKDNYVAVVKTKDLSLVKKIKTDSGPVRVVLFNKGKFAVVTNTVSGSAQIIDIASLNIINSFRTDFSPLPVPINIYINKDEVTAYIANSFVNSISLVDLLTGKIIKTFNSRFMPDGISVSHSENISNMNSEKISDVTYVAGPIEINAGIEKVWLVTKDVEKYNSISHGAVTVHVDGEVVPGQIIKLSLYKDTCLGKLIPESNETITIVDNDRKMLAWMRELPDGKFTERYQVLEKISENKTRSTIVLRIPDPIGSITKATLGKVIDSALTELNNGIKHEAEQYKS